MTTAAQIRERRGPAMIYRRIESQLGQSPLRNDRDLARLVQYRLPVSSVVSLASHGLTDDEIYDSIVPRRTLVHRKTRREVRYFRPANARA